ncbi:hypothetical protein SU69_04805 [Thermosipho melanesiensis]|uniref:DUF4129 domain-containing protein n=3 Tax=Thermosipho melanesiensis TaxID=46541 RepID=A6LLJ9_THEM4|nr:hypothetical protein [Thermosipho melanesiensis]ABR30800.1 hypothetical protein Tmel_0939 [Thermosipho melanesiensis BI429]APT74864.1 hypothetical protein BW47_05040 [Thermosipho melanesiensis]OOC35859.1 hypothetical protein SU68_04860 [Thermosipho melanesiensis]OOC38361.1 hypothetical protein SU69_04805 [Thermosipho melanesiensis]OOC38822.1 hypothetical protein SU70_04805 [Thermosipho melanesiensis]
MINILFIFLFLTAFYEINFYFLIIITSLVFSFYLKKHFYILSFILSIVLFKNPLPIIFICLFDILKDIRYVYFIFLIFGVFFNTTKMAIIASFFTFVLSLNKKKLWLLVLIPLLFIPTIFNPYSMLKGKEYPIYESKKTTNFIVKNNEIENKIPVEKNQKPEETINWDKVFYSLLFFIGISGVYIILKIANSFSAKLLFTILFVFGYAIIFYLSVYGLFSKKVTFSINPKVNIQDSYSQTTTNTKTTESTPNNLSINLPTISKHTKNLLILIVEIIFTVILALTLFQIRFLRKKKIPKISKNNTKWSTKDTYEDIIKLNDKSNLTRRLYVYLRAKIFKKYKNLTPYELLNTLKEKDLNEITYLFVMQEYGMKKIDFDITKIKEDFKKLIQKYNVKSL